MGWWALALPVLGDLGLRGFLDDALQCYDAAIALDPLGPSCVEAHLGRGLAHWRGGRFLEAESCHRAALAVQPHHADAHHSQSLANSPQFGPKFVDQRSKICLIIRHCISLDNS